jgi:putative membrane protein
MFSAILTFIFALLISAVVIWIVGRMNLGMEVDGFMSAVWAALVIAIVTIVIVFLFNLIPFVNNLDQMHGLIGALIVLIVSAVVLMVSDKFLSGMKVNGFSGAIIAAIAIGVIQWLLSWVVGLFV